MKKINKPLLKEYLPVKIFLDDLELIEELFLKPKGNFRVEAEKFEFSSIEKLKQKYQNETITNLTISSKIPYVVIEFNKMWTKLYVGSNNNNDAGLFYKLDQIISCTTRNPSFLYSYYTLWIGSFFFIIVKLLSKEIAYQTISILSNVFIVWLLWVIYIRLSKHSEIILSKRHDLQSFFMRNKDQIVVGAISAILGVVGTVVAFRFGLL